MSRRVFRQLIRRSRAVITALALVAYLATLWGYPVARTSTSDGVAYPCQGHFCGCQSAAQCWQHCCCYTQSERLAWAKAHGVEIPEQYRAVMLAEAEHEAAEHGHEDHDHGRCCSDYDMTCPEADETLCVAGDDDHHKSDRCADHDCVGHHDIDHHRASDDHAPAAVAAAGSKPACSHCKPAGKGETTEPTAHEGGVVWVLGFQAQKCRGISVLWVASGASLPGVQSVEWQFDWCLAGRVSDAPLRPSSLAVIPPVPPPQA